MKKLLFFLLIIGACAGALYAAGLIPPDIVARVRETVLAHALAAPENAAPKPYEPLPAAPLVTVSKAAPATFVETVLATGTLVAREEIMVAPQVDGLRVLDLRADEGDRVEKGQVLATLVPTSLDALLAQNNATLAKAAASIAQAESQIREAAAREKEAKASLERAKPLKQSGYLAQSTYDQRESAARSAEALLAAARDGLRVAEAEKANVEAQRGDVVFRLGNTDVKAPAGGLVSRRAARVGATAALAGEPMFRIIRDGEIELDAEVPETEIAKIETGDNARVQAAGAPAEIEGKVRLVSPEIDRATRLGRVRVFLGDRPALRIGAFGRGRIETATSQGLAVPAAAVMYGPGGAYVQAVEDGKVRRRNVVLGLRMDDRAEIREGLSEGDLVVAKAGTFLRDGDAVRTQAPSEKVSEARP